MKILVLNAGSSSQKSCLYELQDELPDRAPHPIWEAQLDWSHQAGQAQLRIKTANSVVQRSIESQSRAEDTLQMLQTLWLGDTAVIERPDEIDVVGHRVVHGGQEYQESVWIDGDVRTTIDRLSVFAPIHNPVNLQGIKAIEKILPSVPQVAVFDTAFHAHLSAPVFVYPIPYAFLEQGIRRYGFHGISHHYCVHRAAQLLGKELSSLRLINCHLGNGCSLAAVREGQSVDTTMGFTPLEGLMMGTRSGSIDPGILIHWMRQEQYTADQIDRVLNRESGLLGLSGVSNDLRQVVAAIEQGNERAQLAIEVYVQRLSASIAAMLPSLGGLDGLIFTAGVGENSALIRSKTCAALQFLGVQLDEAQNQASPVDQDIAAIDSAVRVLVIHTEEDWAIAQECWRLMRSI